MRLPSLAIDHHQFSSVIILLLVLSGVVSFLTMPRSEDPQVQPAGTTIAVIYPGANPSDMEELVVDPIEEVIHELEDLKELIGIAEDGLAVVSVEFEAGCDADEKYADVVQKVNSVRTTLPAGILRLELTKWSITDVNILQLALISSTASMDLLEREAEILKKNLERKAGVKGVEFWAVPDMHVCVSVDLDRLGRLNIPLSRVMGAIESAAQNVPGGYLDMGGQRFNIRTSGSYRSIDDIAATVINASEGRFLYLRDVARVVQGQADPQYLARFNGERAIYITVRQKPGTNIFTVNDALKPAIREFESQLPDGIRLEKVFDQSGSVATRLNGFFLNLLQGLVLVGIVVFLAVSVRAAILVMLVIPISILIATGFVDLSGMGLQQMTISGMVIALGLLVDNAIVVTENISRFIKQGHDRKSAAVLGTGQIGWPVVSSTATTVLAFVPMMMMGDVTGDFIRSMPVTVVYTLTASLLISLTLTPYLSSRFLPAVPAGESVLRRALEKFIDSRYLGALRFALAHPRIVVASAVLTLIISLSLFPLIGVSFFPKAEKPQFLINIDTPKGTSLEKTDRVARQVESVLRQYPEIRSIAVSVGHGNPRIYYNTVPKETRSTHAQLFVTLGKYQTEEFNSLLDRLRRDFESIAGAKIEAKEFEQGPPVEAPIAIRITGEDLQVLKERAAEVEGIIRGVSGTININNPLSTEKTDLQVKIDREKAGLLGVPLIEIDRAVRAGIAGLPAGSYRDKSGKEYDIVLRLPVRESPEFTDLERIMVSSVTGRQIPLSAVTSIGFVASPIQITHYNMERNVTVTADVVGDLSVEGATRQVVEGVQRLAWPKGYRFSVGGERESRQESFGGMAKAILIAMLGIFGVLVLQFRSYKQPLIIFSAIPLAVIGSILALLITGYSFSFTAFIGLTSLVGIVVNNSILLVDYTNILRREGRALQPALIEAGRTRLIPIVLTTLTTVGGLLPLTLSGGTVYAPMGWTIIGGLLFSTFLTLIVVPVLYELYTSGEIRTAEKAGA